MKGQDVPERILKAPLLWTGYGLFIVVLLVMPTLVGTQGLAWSSYRIGAADTFTVIVTHSILALALFMTFWVKGTAVINSDTVRNMILGQIVEAIGWVLQRSYWLPWYIANELGDTVIPAWLNVNVWVSSFAFVVIWVGVGLSMNIAIRSMLGDKYYSLWPFAWVGVIFSAWVAGYQLADVVQAVISWVP